MAILTAYDRMGYGLNMVDTESSFIPNSSDLIPDGDPIFNQFDSDTYAVSTSYNGGQTVLVIFISQYSGNIWTIESLYAYDSEVEPLLDAYGINIRIDVTDDFSAGGYLTNLYSGNDVMSGNNYADIIKSGIGNDDLKGNAGNDKLYAELGNDTLNGGTGNDTLDGGEGFDWATYSNATSFVTVNLATGTSSGADGVDTLSNIEYVYGSSYNDILTGDANINVLGGGLGDDILDGGAGSDWATYSDKTTAVKVTLNTSTNAIVYVSGVAEDTIKNIENIAGGTGADQLTGDSAANYLSGGAGNDTLNGGTGNDTLDGGEGFDWATYSNATSFVTVNLATGTSSGADGVDTLSNIEYVYGSSYNDILTGDANINVLGGGLGDDILDGGAGSDWATYSDKTTAVKVTLNTSTNAIVYVSGVAEDTIKNIENIAGGTGADQLTGDSAANYLSGGAGNDTLNGGTGADTMTGGSGNDAYFVDAATDVIIESISDNTPDQETFSMGHDNDVVIASVSYTLATDVAVEDMMAAGSLTGVSTNDVINLTGNDLSQGLIGNDAVNTLTGNGGNDILFGMGGNDTLIGGSGDDGFLGGTGYDSMSGGLGIDFFLFNYGSASGSNFVGQQGSSFLTGGNDTIDGGEGSEDTIILTGSLSNYTLTKVSATNYKISAKALLVGANVLETATFTNVERLGFITSLDDLDNNNITFTEISSLPISSEFNDTINGGTGNDTIDGGAGNDFISGGAGNDSLSGGKGNDSLIGGDGNDTLNGGAGNDTLDGGTGADVMWGGSGNDVYYVDNAGDQTNEAISTSNTADATGTDLVYSSVTRTLGNYLENLTLTGTAAINGTGNALANTLTGNAAGNTLKGEAGSDILYGGLGSDSLYGGAGDKVKDVFDFNTITESKTGTTRDKVYDFVTKIDKIDLSGIDANTAAANTDDQAFLFSGTTAKANSVWYKKVDVDGSSATKDIVIYGDVDGNTTADFEIGLVGVTSIDATDFVL